MSTLLLEVLVNGVWQGALIAAAGALLSRLFVRHSARVRHAFWCAVLAAAVLLPVIGGSGIADRGSSTDQGSQIVDLQWIRDRGSRIADRGSRIADWGSDAGSRIEDRGSRIPDSPSRIESEAHATPNSRSVIHDPRSAIPDPGSAIPDPQSEIVTPEHVSQPLLWLYLSITAVLLLGVILDLYRMRRLKRRARPLPLHVEVALARCRRLCGVKRRLRYGASADIDTPVFLGLLRPILLLPAELCVTLGERELLQVGAHELAHAQRRDDWLTLAQRVVLVPLFFNPAVRWICARLSLEREMACDEWAVRRVSVAPDDFAATLLQVARNTVQRRSAFAAAFSGSCLRRRVGWLLSSDFAAPARSRNRVVLAALTFALAVASIGAAPALEFVIERPLPAPGEPVEAISAPVSREPAAMRERLNHAFDQLAAAGFNGAVLVAVADEIVLQRGFGVSDRGTRTPTLATTTFQTGAMAKMLTAAAILRLEEQGRLNVNDRLSKWLGPLPAPKDQITLHHLLVHASGLTPESQPVFAETPEAFIAGLRNTPAEFAPGIMQRHTDIGYSALALVVERASGIAYEEFVRREFIEPAGLQHTWFDPEAPRQGSAVEYSSTFDAGSAVGTRPYLWGRRGAMGIVSTVGDLYRWHQALERGLFDRKQRTRMYSAHIDNPWGSTTGYGWETRTTDRGTTTHHLLSGWNGNGVELMHDPQSGLTIALIIDNRVDWDHPRYDAIARIALLGDASGRAQQHLQFPIRD